MRFFWRFGERLVLPDGLNCVARVRLLYFPPIWVFFPVMSHCFAIYKIFSGDILPRASIFASKHAIFYAVLLFGEEAMTCLVYREDDNGMRVLVSAGLARDVAEAMVTSHETAHKQMFVLIEYGHQSLTSVMKEHNIEHQQ
jgi:hypothetical protein